MRWRAAVIEIGRLVFDRFRNASLSIGLVFGSWSKWDSTNTSGTGSGHGRSVAGWIASVRISSTFAEDLSSSWRKESGAECGARSAARSACNGDATPTGNKEKLVKAVRTEFLGVSSLAKHDESPKLPVNHRPV